MIVFGTLADFGDLGSDREIVVFEDAAAAPKISDDDCMNKDTQDLVSGTYHWSLSSDRLLPSGA